MADRSTKPSTPVRSAAALLAAGRLTLGALYLAAPRLSRQTWFGDSALAPGGVLATRAVAVRELAFGVGTVLALHDQQRLRRWSRVQLPIDLVDLAATLAHRRQIPRRATVFASTLAATAAVCAATSAAG